MVRLAHLLFPTLSLRLVRNAYAGETSCSALLLTFYLYSINKSLNPFAITPQAILDGKGLVIIIMIQDCNFRLISAYLDYIQ